MSDRVKKAPNAVEEAYRVALQNLVAAHDPFPNVCICAAHEDARELLAGDGTPGPAPDADLRGVATRVAEYMRSTGWDAHSEQRRGLYTQLMAVLSAVPAAPDSGPSEEAALLNGAADYIESTVADAEFNIPEPEASQAAACRRAALRAAPLAAPQPTDFPNHGLPGGIPVEAPEDVDSAPREPSEDEIIEHIYKNTVMFCSPNFDKCPEPTRDYLRGHIRRVREAITALRAVPSVPAPQTQQCPSCGGQGKWMEVVGEVSREMASDACEPSMEGQPIEQEMTCSFCGGGGVVEVEPAVPAPPSEEP